MKPIEVACARCSAEPGDRCITTRAKRAGAPHRPRIMLGLADVPCGSCGARRDRPCSNANGTLRMRIHLGRIVGASRARREGK